MPDPNLSLPDYLKILRGVGEPDREEIPVQELAKRMGVNHTTLYKAEAGDSVRWDTLETAYGPLCEGDGEFAHMLALWALSQSRRKPTVRMLNRAMTKVREDSGRATADLSEEIEVLMKRLSPPDQVTLLKFCRRYTESQPTRNFAKAWLDAVDPVEGD